MEHATIPSDFMPSQQMTVAEVEALAVRLAEWRPLVGLFQNQPEPMAIMTEQRQMVWANAALARLADVPDVDWFRGRRTGDALGCVNAHAAPGGCGTSRNCRCCKVAQAILDALRWGEGEGNTLLWLHRDGDVEPLAVETSFQSFYAVGERLLLCRFRHEEEAAEGSEIAEEPPVEVSELYGLLRGQAAAA